MTLEGSIHDALLVRPGQSAIELTKSLSTDGVQLTKAGINKILYAGAAKGCYTQCGSMPPRWSCTAAAPSTKALGAEPPSAEPPSAEPPSAEVEERLAEVKIAEAKLEQRIIEFEAMISARVAELERRSAELQAQLDAQLDARLDAQLDARLAQLDAQLKARLETPGTGPDRNEA